ncbi:Ig-like domain-containing protein [bacterium]|nr:Ig-like domain-containing protein [bacterium]
MKLFKLFICFTILCTCAVQAPPGGGPIDTTSPAIMNTSPENNTANSEIQTEISVTFSKYMNRISVERSVFIAPQIEVDFRWKGKTMHIRPKENLKKDGTYVVTIGSDARDIKNNSMEQSYSWAFSTGEYVDEGKISGKVFGENDASGILIYAFNVNINEDINPETGISDYTTQTDQSGRFRLNNIAAGTYRLFAVKDINKNLLYDVERDYIGIPCCDVTIAKEKNAIDNFFLKLTREDTTAPYLLTMEAVNKNVIEIRTSENITGTSLKHLPDYIYTVSKEEKIQIHGAAAGADERSKIMVYTSAQKPGTNYVLDISGLEDNAGNRIRQKLAPFTGSSGADTTLPYIVSITPEDSSDNVPLQTEIEIQFSEPVDSALVNRNVILKDKDNHHIPGIFVWESDIKCIYFPNSPLTEDTEYTLSIKKEAVEDFRGNSMDGTYNYYFKTGESFSFGSLSGKIKTDNHIQGGLIVINLFEKQTKKETRQLITGNTYKIESLQPGTYILSAYIDTNGDGVFYNGKSFPYKPSYRFTVFDEPVVIRHGWDNENVNLTFYGYK